MKYPVFLKKINGALSYVAGILLIIISALAVFEAIMRGVFNNPTSWSLDLSCYMLVWAVFLGMGYAFQEKGHVAVDLVRDAIEKRWGKAPRRVLAVIGYVIAFVCMVAVGYGTVLLSKTALSTNKLTTATLQIPIVYLYIVIIIGSVLSLITLVFVILDVLGGGDNYL